MGTAPIRPQVGTLRLFFSTSGAGMARDCVRLDASLPDTVSAGAIHPVEDWELRFGVLPAHRSARPESPPGAPP